MAVESVVESLFSAVHSCLSYLYGARIYIKVHSRVILEKVHVVIEAKLKAFLVVVYQLAIYLLSLCISQMMSN